MSVDNNEFSQTVAVDVLISMPQLNTSVIGLDAENGSNVEFDPELSDPLLWTSVNTNNNSTKSPQEISDAPDIATYFKTFDAIDDLE